MVRIVGGLFLFPGTFYRIDSEKEETIPNKTDAILNSPINVIAVKVSYLLMIRHLDKRKREC